MGINVKFHNTGNGSKVAELLSGSVKISGPDDILDVMAEVRLEGSDRMIIPKDLLDPGFFDLKTKIAGEILQKFSNYRMRLAVVGDFSVYKSKSLRDFIRESNRTGMVFFVPTVEEALDKLRL